MENRGYKWRIRCGFYNNFDLLFCYFLIQQYSTGTYTINVLAFIVVAYLTDQPFADHFFSTPFFYLSLAQNSIDYNKLYIGQLPLSITEPFIRDALSKYTEVKDVRYAYFL